MTQMEMETTSTMKRPKISIQKKPTIHDTVSSLDGTEDKVSSTVESFLLAHFKKKKSRYSKIPTEEKDNQEQKDK